MKWIIPAKETDNISKPYTPIEKPLGEQPIKKMSNSRWKLPNKIEPSDISALQIADRNTRAQIDMQKQDDDEFLQLENKDAKKFQLENKDAKRFGMAIFYSNLFDIPLSKAYEDVEAIKQATKNFTTPTETLKDEDFKIVQAFAKEIKDYTNADNIFADISKPLSRGVVSLQEHIYKASHLISKLIGVDTDFFAKRIEKAQYLKEYMASKKNSGAWKTVNDALESTSNSLGALALFAPLGIRGISAGTGTLFGLSFFYDFMKEAEANGIPLKEIWGYGAIGAIAEGGFEALGNYVGLKLLKLHATNQISKPVRDSLLKKLGHFGLAVGIETASEQMTTATQTGMRQAAGFKNVPSITDAVIEMTPSTVLSTMLTMGLIKGADVGLNKMAKSKSEAIKSQGVKKTQTEVKDEDTININKESEEVEPNDIIREILNKKEDIEIPESKEDVITDIREDSELEKEFKDIEDYLMYDFENDIVNPEELALMKEKEREEIKQLFKAIKKRYDKSKIDKDFNYIIEFIRNRVSNKDTYKEARDILKLENRIVKNNLLIDKLSGKKKLTEKQKVKLINAKSDNIQSKEKIGELEDYIKNDTERVSKVLNEQQKFGTIEQIFKENPDLEQVITAGDLNALKTDINLYSKPKLEQLFKTVELIKTIGSTIKQAKDLNRKQELDKEIRKFVSNILSKKGKKINKKTTKIGYDDSLEYLLNAEDNRLNKGYKGHIKKRQLIKEEGLLKTYRVSSLIPENVMDILDGYKNKEGEIWNFYYHKVDKNVNKELENIDKRKEFALNNLKDIFKNDKLKWKDFFKYVKQIKVYKDVEYTLSELIDIYCGSKNYLKNKAIMSFYNFSQDDINNIINHHLTKKDKQIGDLIIKEYANRLPEIQKVFNNVFNEHLELEENYTPLNWDTGKFRNLEDELFNYIKLQKMYPNRSFTYERQDFIDNVKDFKGDLKLGLIEEWLSQTAKQEFFIAHREHIRDMIEVLQHPVFKKSVELGYGNIYNEALANYVQHVANQNFYKNFDSINTWSRKLRGNMAIAYLSWNLLTIGKQIPAVFLYGGHSGYGNLIGAFNSFISNPMEVLDFVNKDPQIKHRSLERELEELKKYDMEYYKSLIKKFGEAGVKGMYYVDKFGVSIGYLATYRKYIKDLGEDLARDKARQVTLETQNAAHPKDIPMLYKSDEFLNWFLIFTNQVNKIYNLTTYDVIHARKAKKVEITDEEGSLTTQIEYTHDFYKKMMILLSLNLNWLFIWMLTEGKIPKSKDDFIDLYEDSLLGLLPIIGNPIVMAKKGFRGGDVPLLTIARDLGYQFTDATTEKKVLAGLEILAIRYRLPYSQPKRIYQAISDKDPRKILWGKDVKKKNKRETTIGKQ